MFLYFFCVSEKTLWSASKTVLTFVPISDCLFVDFQFSLLSSYLELSVLQHLKTECFHSEGMPLGINRGRAGIPD